MEMTVENFRGIDLEKISPVNFIDKNSWHKSLKQFKELKVFIDEMIRITNSNSQIPENLWAKANFYAQAFLTHLNSITKDLEGQATEIATKKEESLKQFDGWYKECLGKTNNKADKLGFYETFNTIKNLEKNSEKKELEKELLEIKLLKREIIDDKNSTNTIVEELRKKGSKEFMSDYSKIFKKESDNHNLSAWIWLIIGILLSALFIYLLVWSDLYKKFPTEELLADGKSIKYNISNLLIKVLLFAVQIFLISFAFKQYSINKHLSTINKHRQNGLDSFKLFVETINKEDTQTRHSLMLQLSKAIYEQTATGFISDRNPNMNSGILEITKMINGNK